MEKKYLLISMEDGGAKMLSGVLGNKTCKKIIDFLSEKKDSSEKEIATALDLPLNTIEYNLKKLLDSELIEKTKNHFWSKKGRKIETYQLSNKSIIISPKSVSKLSSKIKSILPIFALSALGALFIKLYTSSLNKTNATFREFAVESGINKTLSETDVFYGPATPSVSQYPLLYNELTWMWFFLGAIFVISLFLLFNWKKL